MTGLSPFCCKSPALSIIPVVVAIPSRILLNDLDRVVQGIAKRKAITGCGCVHKEQAIALVYEMVVLGGNLESAGTKRILNRLNFVRMQTQLDIQSRDVRAAIERGNLDVEALSYA